MRITELPANVDHLEYNGNTATGDAASQVLEMLDDEARGNVVVVFKNGNKTSLSKLEASLGDDTVRTTTDGKVFF